ncbi:MAG: radical SAM protein [Planctomycetota bacterium]|jgi:putative pyruvate formate lyase activating enzyme
MSKRTRREFLSRAAGLAATGLGSGLIAACEGCAGKSPTGPGSEGPEEATSSAEWEPGYLKLHRTGELARRADRLWKILESCELCPRRCGVNRLEGAEGYCGASSKLEIASHHPHWGEEKSLVGSGGSGTIFMTNCNLRCVFCINWEISQGGQGSECTIEDLARMMLELSAMGCLNINVVTPTHYSPHIVKALVIAAEKGLRLPLVYNTCGWERLEILKLLDGVVDIYLPDFKYSDSEMAAKYSSGAESYPKVTQRALIEMNRQVGVARPARDGKMYRGLMIRHLVMPNRVGGSTAVVKWIATNLPRDTYVNLMSQYRPMHKAHKFEQINRRITGEEYGEVVRAARAAGLINLDLQEYPG